MWKIIHVIPSTGELFWISRNERNATTIVPVRPLLLLVHILLFTHTAYISKAFYIIMDIFQISITYDFVQLYHTRKDYKQ